MGTFNLKSFGVAVGEGIKSFRKSADTIGALARTALAHGLVALNLLGRALSAEQTAKTAEGKADKSRVYAGRLMVRMVRREVAAFNAAAKKAAGAGGKWTGYTVDSDAGIVSFAAVVYTNPTKEEAEADAAAAEASGADDLANMAPDALRALVKSLREQVATLTAERDAARAEVAALKSAGKGRPVAARKAA